MISDDDTSFDGFLTVSAEAIRRMQEDVLLERKRAEEKIAKKSKKKKPGRQKSAFEGTDEDSTFSEAD